MTTQGPRPAIDATRPHPARVYDYLLGGKDHYLVDEEVARRMPQEAQAAARQNRAFMRRAVAFVAGTGVDQFLDIGTGIPTEPNLHQVVQGIDPAARVVYVDNDPVVLAHAEALLVSGRDGATDYVQADLREVDHILERAAATLDLSQPVGLMLIAVLQYIPDADDPFALTAALLDALPSGSHLVVSHPASDIAAEEVAESMRVYNERADEHAGATPRTHDRVTRFFQGTELLEPGVVELPQWRPDAGTVTDTGPLPMWCGVGRKP